LEVVEHEPMVSSFGHHGSGGVSGGIREEGLRSEIERCRWIDLRERLRDGTKNDEGGGSGY
jgi:hypothetical protein